MKNSLHIFIFSAAMLMSFTSSAMAGIPVAPGIEQMAEDDVNISVNGTVVTVTGGQGMTLEVVSLTGRRVMTVRIETPSQRIELNTPKGCYILKIGKVVRKVSVQ